jgi:hypothetical protein
MARFKKFSGGTKITDFEPLTFSLNDKDFACHPAVPGAVLLEFVRDANGEGGDSAAALYNFLEAAMPTDEYNRLDDVLKDPETIIDIEFIGEIVSWLVEEYSDRPTTRPEASSDGQSSSGLSSTDEH